MLSRKLASVALTVAAIGAPGLASAQVSAPGRLVDVPATIQEELGLHHWSLQDVLLPEVPPDGGFDTHVSLSGRVVLLDLHPYTMRSSDFRFLVDVGGRLEERPAPRPLTYRGEVVDAATGERIGRAVATADGADLWASVRLDGEPGRVWKVQPLVEVIPGARLESHVVYHSLDVAPVDLRCGNEDGREVRHDHGGPGTDDGFQQNPGDLICEIAFDLDVPFTTWAGGKPKFAIKNMENLMLDVEAIYENDVGITYEITAAIVRMAWDPYTTTDPNGLLNQFQNHWNNQHGNIRRDVAHLLTGRNLDGSVIGIASLGSICFLNGAYGVSQTTFTSNTTARAALTAHELGHNWSASHCNVDPDCKIMCSGLGGCTGNLTSFGNRSKTAITNFSTAAACLDVEGTGPTLPFFDDFELGAIDPNKWTGNLGAGVTMAARNEPSGIYSAKLNALSDNQWDQDVLTSGEFDLSSFSSGTLSFWTEQRGSELGETLEAQFYATGKRWRKLATITSDGTYQTNFTFHAFALKPGAFHDLMRFRFVTGVDEKNDKWHVDDCALTASALLIWDGGGPNGRRRDNRQSFRVLGAPPDRPVVLFAGLGGLKKRPFDPHRGELDLVGPLFRLAATATGPRGLASVELDLPPGLPAVDFYAQAIVWTPAGMETTPPVLVQSRP